MYTCLIAAPVYRIRFPTSILYMHSRVVKRFSLGDMQEPVYAQCVHNLAPKLQRGMHMGRTIAVRYCSYKAKERSSVLLLRPINYNGCGIRMGANEKWRIESSFNKVT